MVSGKLEQLIFEGKARYRALSFFGGQFFGREVPQNKTWVIIGLSIKWPIKFNIVPATPALPDGSFVLNPLHGQLRVSNENGFTHFIEGLTYQATRQMKRQDPNLEYDAAFAAPLDVMVYEPTTPKSKFDPYIVCGKYVGLELTVSKINPNRDPALVEDIAPWVAPYQMLQYPEAIGIAEIANYPFSQGFRYLNAGMSNNRDFSIGRDGLANFNINDPDQKLQYNLDQDGEWFNNQTVVVELVEIEGNLGNYLI